MVLKSSQHKQKQAFEIESIMFKFKVPFNYKEFIF